MRDVKRDDVFGELAPPPGGLTRLRARLDEERGDVLRWHRAAWAAATVAAVALLWTRPSIAPSPLEATPGLVRLGAASSPRASVTVVDDSRASVAVLAVAETPDVVFYRVSSTRAEPGS